MPVMTARGAGGSRLAVTGRDHREDDDEPHAELDVAEPADPADERRLLRGGGRVAGGRLRAELEHPIREWGEASAQEDVDRERQDGADDDRPGPPRIEGQELLRPS